MLAEIINVSSGLSFIDENNIDAQSIIKELSIVGIDLQFYTDADGNAQKLKKAVSQAFNRSDVVIVTGGIGRSTDDMAKNILVSGLNLELKLHQPTMINITDYYDRAGLTPPPYAQEAAMLPKDCMVFPNDIGVVPGFAISAGNQVVIVMPEHRDELVYMFVKYVFPYLAKFSGTNSAWESARTFGLSIPELRKQLEKLFTSQNYSIAMYDMSDEVLIRVTALSENRTMSANICGDALMQIENILGDYVYGIDVPNMQSAVVSALNKKHKIFAITEAGTNTILHKKISEVKDITKVFSYSMNSTANTIKNNIFDVSEDTINTFGEISEQVTIGLATGVMSQGDADLGLAINMNLEGTGIHQKRKNLCYIALCDNKNVWVKKLDLVSDSFDVARNTASLHALNMVRLYLSYLPEVCPGFMSLEDVRRGKMATDIDENDELIQDDIDNKSFGERFTTRFIPQKKEKTGGKIRKVVFAAAMLCLVGSLSYLGLHYYSSYTNKNMNNELGDLIANSQPHNISGYPSNYLAKFAPLYEINDQIIGWVNIPKTNVNYPVVKSDNEFYLTHDFKREKSKHGAPFVDYRASLQYPSDNIMVYAHNMKDGQMFGDLLNYSKLEYYQEHPTVNFDTVYKENSYKILGVFIANTKESDGPVFDYHNFIDSYDEKEFTNYVHNVKIRSLIDTGIDVKYGDELLTLSTCTYEFADARYVVVARKVRPGEDKAVDTSKAKLATNPLMPDRWYSLYGGTKPSVSPPPAPSKPVIAPSSSSTPSSSSVESSSSSVPSSSSSVPSSSSIPPSSSSVPSSSSIPPSSSSVPPPISSSEEPSSSSEEPSSSSEVEEDFEPVSYDSDEILSVTSGGRVVEGDPYTIISQIVENETRGQLYPEATKAQVVAAYTYVKYYNDVLGQSPSVLLRPTVTAAVKKATNQVLGEAVYYNGKLANTTYFSTSCGATASAKDVWGQEIPYLVSVDSPWCAESPYYKSTYTYTEESMGNLIWDTYNIPVMTTGVDPSEWIVPVENARNDGGYVGTVSIGGRTTSRGGAVESGKAITGRGIREKMLSFGIKSTYFDVSYKNGKFTITSYGYGHGVGMSQHGANGMAKEGYTYKEILEHYYTGVVVK